MQDPSLYQQINPKLPEHEQSNCPRCDSENTKFCYYNNYNLSQPRHYCKDCRRYWTKGGTIRNIPIGGGIRKPTKRGSSSSKESSKSQPVDENQADQDRRIPRTENDHFRSSVKGINLNEFGKDPILGSGSGSDSSLIRNPEVEMHIGDNAERISGFDENVENWQRLK